MYSERMIEHCSPVLGSLKTANLFNYYYDDYNELIMEVDKWNEELYNKGITIEILRVKEDICSALIYFYRTYKLKSDISNIKAQTLLKKYGYDCSNLETLIPRLKDRLIYSDGFPHEIGVFLSYPIDDVISFIEDGGKHSKCVGCWQVYHNEEDALMEFKKYHKCKSIYRKLFNEVFLF